MQQSSSWDVNSAPDVAIQVSGLSHRYKPGRWALRGINCTVRRGRITCLLGPNGAGKSTLVHCLLGLVVPTVGAVTVSKLPASDWVNGFVYDDLPLPEALTGREALAVLASTQVRWNTETVDGLVDVFGMRSAVDELIGSYSHGMKRKLQVIASLGSTPDLWVLDEPFRGLDPVATEIVRALLRVFRSSGGSVVVATHDLLAAREIGDDYLILSEGSIAARGSLDSVSKGTTLSTVYLEATGLSGAVDAAQKAVEGLRLTVSSHDMNRAVR